MPHSHTDLGWLSTVDEYFEGRNLDFYLGSVNSMLSSVVRELAKDPRKTFTYAEMEFFKRWWERQDDKKKELVRKLIRGG